MIIKIDAREMSHILHKAGAINERYEVKRVWRIHGAETRIGIEVELK